MKNLLLLPLLLASLVACQQEALAPAAAYPQTWQLVRMTGQIPNSATTGAAMAWQETYVLQADGTFSKTREQDQQRAEARGTFAVQQLADAPYLVLTYAAPSPLIGSCTAELQEVLALRGEETLLSTWQACDGPGLVYAKRKPALPD
jgi:hypothetical protein